MDRKLLPYEHQLIEALGVTKEEYLNFVAIQQEYQDPKVGTQLDVRNEAGTVAIVLTVVGILFQVGAALLTPKPKVPSFDKQEGGNRRNSREARFAPTFGFNSAQELAVYNDPVNLVYTNKNQNSRGGVRLSGSLVWSELESYGSAQYMTLLLAMGASAIGDIEPDLTAFGQIAIKDLDPTLVSLFFDDNGSGHVQFKDIKFGVPEGKGNSPITQKIAFLPPSLKQGVRDSTNVCRLRPVTSSAQKGFSQAYSPTTATAFGAYDPIPVFVKLISRDGKGDVVDAPINVSIRGDKYPKTRFDVGDTVSFEFKDNRSDAGDDDVAANAASLREQYVETLDYGAIYMLGSAKFRLESIVGNDRSIAGRTAVFNFECVEGGQRPSTDYKNDELVDQQRVTFSLKTYTSYRNLLQGSVTETASFDISGFGLNHDFSGTTTVNWTDFNGNKKSKALLRNGSIEFSEKRRRLEANNKPKLDTAVKRRQIRKDIRLQEDLIDDIKEGRYDVYSEAPHKTALARTLSKRIREATRRDNRLKVLKRENERLADQRVLVDQSNKSKKRKRKLLNNIQKKIETIQEQISSRELVVSKKQRRPFIDLTRKAKGQYTAINGTSFIAGTRVLLDLFEDKEIASGLTTDQTGANAINTFYENLIDEKKQALEQISSLTSNWDARVIDETRLASKNKAFFTKCLVKAESASYETVSEVDLVKFSLKATLYRRISGRQKKYAEEKVKKYSASDNGLKARTGFFRVKYKRVQDNSYDVFPVVFAVRHGTESAFYGQLNFEPSAKRQRWQFKFEPVFDLIAEIRTNGQKGVGFIESEGKPQRETENNVTWTWFGRKAYGFSFDGFPEAYASSEKPPLTFEHDMFSNTSDTDVQFSFNNGPEFTLAAVTEQQIASGNTEINGYRYAKLSTMAIIVRAGRGIEDLRNITAYVKEGKSAYVVPRLASQPFNLSTASTSYAPDIFVDTVIDKVNGVGKYIPNADAVLDKHALVQSKNFCKANYLPTETGGPIQMFFDGVIADITSWREFWISNAPFSLLEFVRKNGKEALVPAIPTNSAGRAAESNGKPVPLQISALFTSGNILEGSYKEEFLDYGPTTQDLVATIVYRDTTVESVFDKKTTVQVKIKGTSSDAVNETFDASAFVTQKEQAIMIGKLLVNQRRYIRRGIEFKTFPSQDPLEPGAFIYVDVGNQNWDKYSSGVVMAGGALNVPLQDTVGDGQYDFLVFDPKTGVTVKLNNKQVTNKTASSLAVYKGFMFVMGQENPSKRVFRITEVAIDEEGEVSVKAMEYPCDSNLRAKVADFRKDLFEVS